MRRQRLLLFLSAILSVTLWTYACGDGTTEPPPDPPRPTTVTVSPATAELAALGATVQLSAQVQDQNGQVMSGATVAWASSATAVATVSATGLVTAAGNGTATITATSGQASGSATVTVTQEVSSVTVAPAEANFAALGDTLRLTAEALDANGSAVTGVEFSWGTNDDAVATVDGSGLVTAMANGTATITATSGGASGTATVTVAQVVSSVTVAPAEANFAALGDTLRLTAQAFDANGQAVTGAEFSWESNDDAVATVDGSGLVTAAANGTATITATAGQASASAMVTVAQVVSSVAVAPAEASLAALGDTLRLTAEAFDANGSAVTGVEFSWESSATAVATVDATGLATAVANGTATITATSGQASASATVTVAQEVSSVTVVPAEANFLALGDTLRLTAEAFDANGSTVTGAEFSWGTSDDVVATVDGSGLVTATANGTATITATSGQASAGATVTVAQEVSSVTVVPAEANLAALGDTLRLTGQAFDANGHAVAGAEFSWGTSDDAVATVDATGLVTAIASGSVTITATAGPVSGSATVTVAQDVSSVTLVPDTAMVVEGDTLRIAATATDANGQVVTGAGFAWGSGDTTVAVVDATGLVTGVGAGQVQVTATTAGVTGRAELTVVAPVPTTVAVTPDTVVLTSLGQTAQLAADVRDQLGRMMDGVGVAWSSADTTVVVVDSTGLVTAVGGGVATVTATAGEVSGDAIVTVMQSAGSVTVSPPAHTIAPGDTLRLVAEAYDETGHVVAGAVFTWSSNDAPVATVDPSGLVRGAGEGTATITATAGDASGTSEITVVNPDRAALVALYNATDGRNWVDNTNWLTDAPLGEWYGVSMDAAGRVAWIDLAGQWDSEARAYVPHGLRGELPHELTHLTHLVSLRLSNNDLGGPIPPELGGLSNLRDLYLIGSSLSGAIPPELGNLANLEWLRLGGNALSGPIPPELGGLANLEVLELPGNELSGPIPPELGDLANLEWLRLGGNALSGPIPPELGDLANLEWLRLGANDLSGPIPPELGGLSNLQSLSLEGNGLTGPIPPELGGLSNLEILDLGRNALSGAIPPELGGLSSLRGLYLEQNALSGPIPPELGGLSNLASLDLNNNDLTGAIPPELGSLSNLVYLYLNNNDLTGAIPPELGDLANLWLLYLNHNDLSGAIPQSFLELNQLRDFRVASGQDVCVPGTSAFVAWYTGVEQRESEAGVFCNATDVTALESLYDRTDGASWNESGGWLSDDAVEEWYGVTADSLGHVTELDLEGNGLAGRLSAALGNMPRMTVLRIGDNALSGRLPLSLTGLPLVEFRYSETELCAPAETSFQGWLNAIESLDGTGVTCGPLPDRGILEILYDATGGSNWTNRARWLTDAPLREWYGVDVDGEGRVSRLLVSGNNLTGLIPSELGGLANLDVLGLSNNNLTGPIPPELGGLSNLQTLSLEENDLSGPIPPELGGLSNLRTLRLHTNALSGPIPPELGSLSNLEYLVLSENDLSGPIPAELGSLSSLRGLYLEQNALSGPIPAELGSLSSLRGLYLEQNALSGPIPRSFLQLDQLQQFLVGGQDVCVPGASAFVAWFDGIGRRDARADVLCNAADVAALESLYDLTDGANWTKSDGWLSDHPVEDWYGVTTDSLGHVTELDLEGNGLAGRLSGALGNLPRMTVLRIADNALEDRLPLSLIALDLDEFHYDGTDLCEPADADFQRWLEGIASHRGTAVQCAPLTDRDALIALYANTGGAGWTNSDDWLSDAPLQRWNGVTTDAQGRVVGLALGYNGLSGAIPPELGELSNLRSLQLHENDLSGAIPPELGELSNLRSLQLHENDLSGEIPPELGSLSNLEHLFLLENDLSGAIPPELGGLSHLGILHLEGNELSGAIPPELGDLSNLWRLELGGNELAGPIPSELGDLANLWYLSLAANDLSGPIPPTFSGLASLIELELSHNAGLAGAMPAGLRNLALESLLASGTDLCVSRDPVFEEWLATIPRRRIAVCGEPPAAYLVQAVQSRAHPVPLVAGEDALLRVFVTAAMETTEGIPDVRARFYLNGAERHVVDIPGSSTPIPTEIDEGDLAMSANAEIPGWLVQPGLEMVVEIDPDGVLDASLGVARRIPQEGRLAVEVREMPVLGLTVIPFLWSSDPDSAIIGLVEGMAADPEGHALLEDTHVLLPVGGIDVAARAPVASTSNKRLQPAGPDRGDPRAGGRGRPLHGDDVGTCDGWFHRTRPRARPVELLAATLGHSRPRARAQHEPPARPLRGRTETRPVVPVSERSDRRLGVRLPPRSRGAGNAEGPHDLLRSRLDQRLPLHQRAPPPAGRRGRVVRGARRLPGQDSATLGRRRHNRHPLPQPHLRRGRPARTARLGRRLHRDRTGRQRPRTLLPQLHDARGPVGGGGGVVLRLRAAGRAGLGGRARERHAIRTRRHHHPRRRQRHLHGHPARSCYGPREGLPARRGGSRGGRARAVGGWAGRSVQPRDSGRLGLETLTLTNHGFQHQQPPGRSGPPQRPYAPPHHPPPRCPSTTPQTNHPIHPPPRPPDPRKPTLRTARANLPPPKIPRCRQRTHRLNKPGRREQRRRPRRHRRQRPPLARTEPDLPQRRSRRLHPRAALGR